MQVKWYKPWSWPFTPVEWAVLLGLLVVIVVAVATGVAAPKKQYPGTPVQTGYTLQNGVSVVVPGEVQHEHAMVATVVKVKAKKTFTIGLSNQTGDVRKVQVFVEGQATMTVSVEPASEVKLVYPGKDAEFRVECDPNDKFDFPSGNIG